MPLTETRPEPVNRGRFGRGGERIDKKRTEMVAGCREEIIFGQGAMGMKAVA